MKILKSIRRILAIPFLFIGSGFYYAGEIVAGELYSRRSKETKLEMVNEMNRKQYRNYKRTGIMR